MIRTLLLLLAVFAFATVQAQLDNGGFEDFGEHTFNTYERQGGMYNPDICQVEGGTYVLTGTVTNDDRPVGFSTTDDFVGNATPSYVVSTTDAFEGNTAVKLQGDGFFAFGIVGKFDVETLVQELVPVDYEGEVLPLSISGAYKHTSGNPVTISAGSCTNGGVLAEETVFTGGFAVLAEFYDDMGNIIAVADTVFGDAAEYTGFSVDVEVLTPGAVPVQYIFVMSSCPDFRSPNPINVAGSESFVDAVAFNLTTSAEELSLATPRLSLFPNPVQHTLHIESLDRQSYRLLDMLGQEVLRGYTDEGTADVSRLSPGLYLFQSGDQVQRLVKQ